MAWCEYSGIGEEHKPHWESVDRRAFMTKKTIKSVISEIVNACKKELLMANNPFRPISGTDVVYHANRYLGLGCGSSSLEEKINVTVDKTTENVAIIWLTRTFPVFDFFMRRLDNNGWTRYDIYISENEMADSTKLNNRIEYEVTKFLDLFISIEDERTEEKEMGEQTHKEIVDKVKIYFTRGTSDKKFEYKKIIFSGPATIILWEDGTKTVVKCSPDQTFDPYSGVAIAFMKKVLGNGNKHRNKKIMRDIRDAAIASGKVFETEQDPNATNLWIKVFDGLFSSGTTSLKKEDKSGGES